MLTGFSASDPLYLLSLALIFAFCTLAPYGKLYLDPLSTGVNLSVIFLNHHQEQLR